MQSYPVDIRSGQFKLAYGCLLLVSFNKFLRTSRLTQKLPVPRRVWRAVTSTSSWSRAPPPPTACPPPPPPPPHSPRRVTDRSTRKTMTPCSRSDGLIYTSEPSIIVVRYICDLPWCNKLETLNNLQRLSDSSLYLLFTIRILWIRFYSIPKINIIKLKN